MIPQHHGRGRGRGFSSGGNRGAARSPRGRGAGDGPRNQQYYLNYNLPPEPHPSNRQWVLDLNRAFAGRGDVTALLQEALYSTTQPFLRALDLVVFSADYHKHRPDGLTAAVLTQLRMLVQKEYGSMRCVPPTLLTEMTKRRAFWAMCGQEKGHIADAIVELFDLTGSQMFVADIQDMIAAQDYKKACQVATRLSLQSSIDAASVVVPLILQDKPTLVENFLDDMPREQQKEVIRAIDDLIGKGPTALASEYNLITSASNKVNHKSLKKLVERLCKKHQFSSMEVAPKAALSTAHNQLNFIMYRRFIEGSLTPDDAYDFLIEILGQFEELLFETLDRLCEENAYRTAIDLARLFQLGHRDVPHPLPYELFQMMYERYQEPGQDNDKWSRHPRQPASPNDYYRMPARVQVHWVDSLQQVVDVCNRLRGYDGLLALDAEWKPLVMRETRQDCALLQVSTEDAVYVLDLLSLQLEVKHARRTDEATAHMGRLGEEIFTGQNLKLGYDCGSDLDVLEESIPAFGSALSNRKNMIDVRTLSDEVNKAHSDCWSFKPVSSRQPQNGAYGHDNCDAAGEAAASKEMHNGLSEVVRKCFGRPLNKDEQCSNWERRPLRETQLQYAATDAYCLIAVYRYLEEKLRVRHRVSPQQLLKCVITDAKSVGNGASATASSQANRAEASGGGAAPPIKQPKKKACPPAKEMPNAAPPNVCAIQPEQFRVVCDTMVQGLGEKLRSIGVDTVILENGEDHDNCVHMARMDGRVILTRGVRVHQRLSGLVPAGHCYRVQAERAADQLDEVVRHFKLDVAPEDLFKRCQHCNSGDYWHVPSDVMRRIRDRYDVGWLRLEGGGTAQVCCQTGVVRGTQVHVQPEHVRDNTLTAVDKFYVCQGCGHVYWAGSHHGRFMAGLGDVVQPRQGSRRVCPPEEVATQFGRMRVVVSDSDSDDY